MVAELLFRSAWQDALLQREWNVVPSWGWWLKCAGIILAMFVLLCLWWRPKP